ncbi:helix-turn-helix transcriptional regulator [Actinosynnema sp. NPDC020468]|uniref:helix-turn-helix domain-containing protein n=1 Tax=Actinosynnema sp. NPDC020468 TaxID=3154488 RepID=UPI0033EDE795
MTEAENTPSTWWDYIEKNLEYRGISTGELARRAGIDRSRFTDWRKGKSASLEAARAIAGVFDASPLEVMVAAGLITEQEARQTRTRPDPGELSDDELVAELTRRLRRG